MYWDDRPCHPYSNRIIVKRLQRMDGAPRRELSREFP
jgi:hypothetical protein